MAKETGKDVNFDEDVAEAKYASWPGYFFSTSLTRPILHMLIRLISMG